MTNEITLSGTADVLESEGLTMDDAGLQQVEGISYVSYAVDLSQQQLDMLVETRRHCIVVIDVGWSHAFIESVSTQVSILRCVQASRLDWEMSGWHDWNYVLLASRCCSRVYLAPLAHSRIRSPSEDPPPVQLCDTALRWLCSWRPAPHTASAPPRWTIV